MKLSKDGKILLSEKDVKKSIRDYLKTLQNCVYWHNLQGLGSYKGLPDYEGIYGGRHFYIEAKGSRGSQRPDQVIFQQKVEAQGELYILADKVDVVIREFESLLSLCQSCWCMTKTINFKCGKCKANKP